MPDGRTNLTLDEVFLEKATEPEQLGEIREYKNIVMDFRGSEIYIRNRKTGRELVFDRKEWEGATEIFNFIEDAIPQWIGKRNLARGRTKKSSDL